MTELLQCKLNRSCQKVIGIMFVFYLYVFRRNYVVTVFCLILSFQPETLAMYDWEHPDKLMAGEQIDLGRSHPKDSMFLKVIAEQLTLMEFAVYAAVQRR